MQNDLHTFLVHTKDVTFPSSVEHLPDGQTPEAHGPLSLQALQSPPDMHVGCDCDVDLVGGFTGVGACVCVVGVVAVVVSLSVPV